MTPIPFQQQTIVIAEDQPEYLPLPAHVTKDGIVTSCWQLTEIELAEVKRTGVIWLSLLTFGDPLQPILLRAFCPFVRASE